MKELCKNCTYENVPETQEPCSKCYENYAEGTVTFGSQFTEKSVNHPSHYNREGAMETIDEMVTLFGVADTMVFCKLNAWKYRARAMQKNGEEDMKKSDWYIAKYKELKDSLGY